LCCNKLKHRNLIECGFIILSASPPTWVCWGAGAGNRRVAGFHPPCQWQRPRAQGVLVGGGGRTFVDEQVSQGRGYLRISPKNEFSKISMENPLDKKCFLADTEVSCV